MLRKIKLWLICKLTQDALLMIAADYDRVKIEAYYDDAAAELTAIYAWKLTAIMQLRQGKWTK